ncbi:hypothetical protein ACOMHN_016538 [Nucella lapillus]
MASLAKKISESVLSSLTNDLKPDIPGHNRLKRSWAELEKKKFTRTQQLRHNKEQIAARTQHSIQTLSKAERAPSVHEDVQGAFSKNCIPGFRYRANGDAKPSAEEARKEAIMRSLKGLSRHVFEKKSTQKSKSMVTHQHPPTDSVLSGISGHTEPLELPTRKHVINRPFGTVDDDISVVQAFVDDDISVVQALWMMTSLCAGIVDDDISVVQALWTMTSLCAGIVGDDISVVQALWMMTSFCAGIVDDDISLCRHCIVDDDSDLRVRKVQEQLGLCRHQGPGALDSNKTISMHTLDHFKALHFPLRSSEVDIEVGRSLSSKSSSRRKRMANTASAGVSQTNSDAASSTVSSFTSMRDRFPRRKIFLWKKADVEGMRQDVKEFANTYQYPDPSTPNALEQMWSVDIKQMLSETVEKRVPSKTSAARHTNPWITTSIRRAIRRKQRAHKKACMTGKKKDVDRYRRIQAQTRYEVRQASRKYLEDVSSNSTALAKPRWRHSPSGRYVPPPLNTLRIANPTLYRHAKSGAVFAFGRTKFADSLPNKFWVKNERVLHLACGDEHSILVAESGRVFVFGPNDWGQLGMGELRVATRPMCIKSLKHERCTLAACGRSHTLIATESGRLYACGANGEGQLGVVGVRESRVPVHIASVRPASWTKLAAGCEHSMALSEEGQVWVWGSNGEGQLGLEGRREAGVPIPLDIGQPVTCIAAGYYHSALVTESGELWTWGEQDGGKLGLGSGDNSKSSRVPQHVRSITDRVRAVSCGGSHTAVLTELGAVYTCGDGSSGQLGLGVSVMETHCLRRLALPFTVAHLCCGENFTALVTDSGQLYTFGDGRHGKLGLGPDNTANQFSAALVCRLVHLHADQVACGGCHMIVRARPKTQTKHRQNSLSDEDDNNEEEESDSYDSRLDVTGDGENVHSYDGSWDQVRNLPVVTAQMRQVDLHSTARVQRQPCPSLQGRRCEGPCREHLTCYTKHHNKGRGSRDGARAKHKDTAAPKKKMRHPAKGPPASSGWDAQLGTSMSPMEAERTARCVSLRLSRLKHGPTWDLRAYAPLHFRVWRGSACRDEVSSFVKGLLLGSFMSRGVVDDHFCQYQLTVCELPHLTP